ncbi:MAG: gluconate 2-dehydrogenase subunit 3 family protein [Janthinobacterium lividum]
MAKKTPQMPHREPLTDPQTGAVLAQRDQPGYYPGYTTLSQKKYWDETTRKVVVGRATETKPIRFFTPEEARTMDAVMDRILPQDDRTPDHRVPLLPSLDERLFVNRIEGYRYDTMPSDQEAYRIAAQAIDQMARELHGKRFDELGTLDQELILKSLHDDKPLAAQKEWKRMSLERFWAMLVSDACSVYYAHPWAWDEIGFGGPAYPRGYMRLEEGEPEPWEVAEQRYRWTPPADTISNAEEPMGSGKEHDTPHSEGGTH